MHNELADKIREDYMMRDRGRNDWITGTINLCLHLAEGRARFTNNTDFSYWLKDNNLDRLNHQDRAAAIKMGENSWLLNEVLNKTSRLSLQLIYEEEFKRFTSAGKPAEKQGEKGGKTGCCEPSY